jgi:hypothetical protein
MIFTFNGERYHVFISPWTGVWVVGEFGIAYRGLLPGLRAITFNIQEPLK